MAAEELAGTHTTRTPDMKVTVTAKTTVEVHTGHTTTQHQAEAAPAAIAAGATSGHKPESITFKVQRPFKGSGRSLQLLNAVENRIGRLRQ